MKDNSCSCDTCVSYCKFNPGWFKPEELQQTANLLNMSVQELFNQHLVVDYWCGGGEDGNDILVLAPVAIGETPGHKRSWDIFNETICHFLNDKSLCDIHKAKPFECRMTHHDNPTSYHWEAAKAWNTPENQAFIYKLMDKA